MAKSNPMSNSNHENDEGEASNMLESPADTEPVEDIANESQSIVLKRAKVSTPISLLIESLVKSLCHLYEQDTEKSSRVYNLICNQLFLMNLIDESYRMEEFENIRTEYQKVLHQTIKMGDDKTVALRPVFPSADWLDSRYQREFEELEYIAGGGFGQVFKVKHKLDGTLYAVKKIPIRAEGIKAVCAYLSEVKTFASLNHSNVVQYKAAWLELGAPSTTLNGIYDETESLTEDIKSHIDDDNIYHQEDLSFSDNRIIEDTSDFEVSFEHSVSATKHSTEHRKREKRHSISEGGKAICKLDMKELRQLKVQQKSLAKWATLYIQMSLCMSTLKQWLERRNNAELPEQSGDTALVPVSSRLENETVNEVLKQLLNGLEYIHSKGIVHHDIKPSNIFIQIENGKLLVQLGDFGLACPLQSVRHSLAFGTKLYAAPEQLAGKCDPQSDMYSLGIVLFELVERFRTDMERVHFINELRKGILPAHVHSQHPQLAQIICQLTQKDPNNRPDASTLLKTISHQPDEYVRELECKLVQQEEEISKLKELLKSAGVDPFAIQDEQK